MFLLDNGRFNVIYRNLDFIYEEEESYWRYLSDMLRCVCGLVFW